MEKRREREAGREGESDGGVGEDERLGMIRMSGHTKDEWSYKSKQTTEY